MAAVGWFPDPTPQTVIAPGWGETPPVQTDPLVEVGWWAVVGLDIATTATPVQSATLELIQALVFYQEAATSQSAVLQKIAMVQLVRTAPASQTTVLTRAATVTATNTAGAIQAATLSNNKMLPYDLPFIPG